MSAGGSLTIHLEQRNRPANPVSFPTQPNLMFGDFAAAV
jgi:hypothetical protein